MRVKTMSNVVELLQRQAARVPDRNALVFGVGNAAIAVSFAELWRRLDCVSVGLRRRGLHRGDRVIVMIPMSPQLYVVLLGVLKMGAVAVFVDPWIGMRQLAAFAAFAEPQAWIGVGRSHLLRLGDPRLRRIALSVTTGKRFLRFPAAETLAALEAGDPDGAIVAVDANDPALITFTSGSSGVPKGANRTHGFLAAQHRALQRELTCSDTDVDMPMFPVFALNNLAQGITSVVPAIDFRRVDDIDAAAVARQLRDNQVSTCTASPPFIEQLVRLVAADPSQRIDLRSLVTGGAPVTDGQLRRWVAALPDTGIEVVYGSTEAEPVARISADQRLELAASSPTNHAGVCVGTASTLVRVKIVRISREPLSLGPGGFAELELPVGEVGEVVVSGEHICADYYRNPDAVRHNKVVDESGALWHRMGDTGYLDEDGRLWLVGRVHATILRQGRVWHPLLLEQTAASGDPTIAQVAAVGLPDETLGERTVVVVRSSRDKTSLATAVAERLAGNGLEVDEIVVVDRELPLDPRHRSKIDYPRLRGQLLTGGLRGARTG